MHIYFILSSTASKAWELVCFSRVQTDLPFCSSDSFELRGALCHRFFPAWLFVKTSTGRSKKIGVLPPGERVFVEGHERRKISLRRRERKHDTVSNFRP